MIYRKKNGYFPWIGVGEIRKCIMLMFLKERYLYIALKSSDISADSDGKIQFYKLTGSLFKNYSISLQNPWKYAISPM